ncbi:MAG TPA: hypothetical protein DIU35_01235 [Candidatus Latescibacteria bacterium]|nr:hypothetical protein [Candidatus Latescibacterota bacterium]|tara:strand:+ start:1606 stop:3474 length:1869 start_codon:yes stop_codon:yes gene_type:complete
MNLFHKSKLVLLAVLCSTTLSSCVYYNTFYNAKKKYRQAEKRREEAENAPDSRRNTRAIYAYRDLYMKVIRKASVVLDRHPKSKWVDDSLLLIGKCFYWRGGYKDALLKFQELQENFPNSPLLSESFYWQGLSLWASGKPDDARVVLGFLSENSVPSFSGEARLALAELESDEGNYEAAIDTYLRLKSQTKDKRTRAKVWDGLGDARYHLEQYDEALMAYRKVLKSKSSLKANYETRLQIGLILERQNKLDEALKIYKGILKEKLLKSFESEVQIKRGNVYNLKGDLDRSIKIYEKLIEDFPRTDQSAEAYYRMALIEQKQRKDLAKAKELYEEARKQKPGSEAGKAARELERNLSDLEKYKKAAAKNNKKSLDAIFNMAQIYLFNLSEPDSALVCYRKALAMADTTEEELAPKALYAIGLVYADTLENEEEARRSFQKLLDRYPVSSYAIDARNRLEGTRTDDALAEARFLEAEALRDEGAEMEDYLEILMKLPDEYPHSMFAPRALYAVAFTYETNLENLDAARTYYEQLVEHYPLTDFAEMAGQKLESDLLKPATPPKEEETPKDTSEATEQEGGAKNADPPSKDPAETKTVQTDNSVSSIDSTQKKKPNQTLPSTEGK